MTRQTEGSIFRWTIKDLPKIFVILTLSIAKGKDPRIPLRLATPLLGVTFLLLAFATTAHAQGCTQCLDSTQATPPAVQSSYRHAIELLGGAGVALFLAGLYLLRREP